MPLIGRVEFYIPRDPTPVLGEGDLTPFPSSVPRKAKAFSSISEQF